MYVYVYFKNKTKSLMTLFCYYLQDNNGTIENEELRGFLKDLLELVKKVCIRLTKVFIRNNNNNNDSFITPIIITFFVFLPCRFLFSEIIAPETIAPLAHHSGKIDFNGKFKNYTFISCKDLNAT